MSDFENAVVVVTGAGRGIGAATAVELATRGARVVVVARTEAELQRVSQRIAQEGAKPALPVRADVTVEAEVKNVFREVRERFGPVTHLVNNVGTVVPARIAQMTLEQYRTNVDVNLTSAFLCSRAALEDMLPAKRGRIVNVASVSGVANVPKFPGFVAYAAAKAGVISFSEALAAEVGPDGVRVLCVSPGSTDTRLFDQVAPGVKADLHPMQVAKVIRWALSDEAGVANGTNVVVWGK